jgi:hypothetical protein
MRSFAIAVSICENAVAIWLGCVSVKKLFELPAHAGNTARLAGPSRAFRNSPRGR